MCGFFTCCLPLVAVLRECFRRTTFSTAQLVPPPPSGVTAEEAFRRKVLTNVNTTIDAVAVRVMTLPATLKLMTRDAASLLPGEGNKRTPNQ